MAPRIRLVTQAPGRASRGSDPLDHLDALHRVAWRLTRHAADADDLVQETYLRAIRGAERFTPGTNLRAWLFRVLRNAFLDRYRRERSNRAAPEDEAEAAGAAESRDGWLRGDAELERLRAVVAEEIEAALRQLPEEARTVVLLDVEGLGEAEIAQVMDCAPGTVKSRLHRARSRLRVLLADYRR
jgi:RNA polymerase sigma-70 factor, ECF subfamily